MMQCFAYAFMPLQITTYIFWLMGFLYCLAFDWGIDNWFVMLLLFVFSYNWTGFFLHLLICLTLLSLMLRRLSCPCLNELVCRSLQTRSPGVFQLLWERLLVISYVVGLGWVTTKLHL